MYMKWLRLHWLLQRMPKLLNLSNGRQRENVMINKCGTQIWCMGAHFVFYFIFFGARLRPFCILCFQSGDVVLVTIIDTDIVK